MYTDTCIHACACVQGLKNTVDWGIKMAKIREMRLSNFANKPITNAKVLMKEIRRKATAGRTKHQIATAFRRFHHVASGPQRIDLEEFNVSYCLALQRIYDCMSPG